MDGTEPVLRQSLHKGLNELWNWVKYGAGWGFIIGMGHEFK